jgi:hypothetical protein
MALSSIMASAIRSLRIEEARIARELDAIRDQIRALSGVAGGRGRGKRGPGRPPGSKGKMSAAGRAAISRAAKRRWAAWRRAKGPRK